ncbi:cysteine-rich CWC family protein [Shewanella algae]|uniref:cysteine-rich CWC family protein n=1 Tax=Shewanella algae TaxID=38313 RepID=UPI001C5959D8|nr:cysteine-rich CWC family protein [Shewanella algae]
MTDKSAALCPVCRQANQCAMAAGTDPALCWCMQADFSYLELALRNIPRHSCICSRCLHELKQEKSTVPKS